MTAVLSKRRFARIVAAARTATPRPSDLEIGGLQGASELLSLADIYAEDGAFDTARDRALVAVGMAISCIGQIEDEISARKTLLGARR